MRRDADRLAEIAQASVCDSQPGTAGAGLRNLKHARQSLDQPKRIVCALHVDPKCEKHLMGHLVLHDVAVELLRESIAPRTKLIQGLAEIAFLPQRRTGRDGAGVKPLESLLGLSDPLVDLRQPGIGPHTAKHRHMAVRVIKPRDVVRRQAGGSGGADEIVEAIEKQNPDPLYGARRRKSRSLAELQNSPVGSFDAADQRLQFGIGRVEGDHEMVRLSDLESCNAGLKELFQQFGVDRMPVRNLLGRESLAAVANGDDGQHEQYPNAKTPSQIVGANDMTLSVSARAAGVTPVIISDVGYLLA